MPNLSPARNTQGKKNSAARNAKHVALKKSGRGVSGEWSGFAFIEGMRGVGLGIFFVKDLVDTIVVTRALVDRNSTI